MSQPAARVGDMHACPMASPATPPVPHVGGPIIPPGAINVLIGGQPAARMGDMCTCVGPPDVIVGGAPTVLIGGKPAARMGDMTAHGGSIVMGFPSVLIGIAGGGGVSPPAAPAPPKSTVDKAIEKIEKSEFGKTEEGKKVVKKLKQLKKDGKIEYGKMKDSTRGEWDGSKVIVNDKYKNDVDATASELVHEATHGLNEDEFPASKTKITIDEEMRTNKNQLDLYEEQRKDGFRDPELERRRRARKNGKLRDDVRSRYPGTPESL